jgi:hypothetical protein
MERLRVDAEIFALKFNSLFQGSYRKITANKVREMTKCGLIGRSGYFEQMDLHTVNGIIRYELLRNQRINKLGKVLN